MAFSLVLWVLVAVPAFALAADRFFFGPRLGLIPGDQRLGTAVNFGGLFGCEVASFRWGSWALEAGGTITVAAGEDSGGTGETWNEGDYTLDVVGVWLSYRSPGRIYLLGKAGYRHLYFTEIRDQSRRTWTEKGPDFLFGVGWRFAEGWSLEADYALPVTVVFAGGEQAELSLLGLQLAHRF